MHTKAHIAEQAVRIATATGTGATGFAWWGVNSAAITAICAFLTFIVVMVTAIINWYYKHKHMEAKMADDKKPVKEDKKPKPNEPAPSDKSVPCGDENNPC